MRMSLARSLVFGIARRVPPSEYSKVIIEHVGRVQICKMIFTYRHRENDISQMQYADNFLDNATCHQGQVIIRAIFPQPAAAYIGRRFPWHVLSKQRSCPLITGFSSIRVWVIQLHRQWRRVGVERVPPGKWRGAKSIYRPYKEIRSLALYPRLLLPLAHSPLFEP